MLKKKNIKHLTGYIFFVLTLTLLTIIYFRISFLNFLGEKSFLYFHENNLSKSILNFAINFNFSENKDSEENLYYTYFLLGRVNFILGDLKSAVINFNKSIELNPKFKEAYYGLGLSYGYSPLIYSQDAENAFKKYIDLDMEEFSYTGQHAYGAWAAYNDLAWIYFMRGDFEESEKVAKTGLEISSGNAWLMNMLGVSLLEQGKCEEAKKYFNFAEFSVNSLTPEQFGQAYSGDNPSVYKDYLNNMKKAILENKDRCKEEKQS